MGHEPPPIPGPPPQQHSVWATATCACPLNFCLPIAVPPCMAHALLSLLQKGEQVCCILCVHWSDEHDVMPFVFALVLGCVYVCMRQTLAWDESHWSLGGVGLHCSNKCIPSRACTHAQTKACPEHEGHDTAPGGSLREREREREREKKRVPIQSFRKRPHVAHMFNHGWWRVAVGGWWQLAVGGWQLASGGWWLVIGASWRLVAVGGWQLVVPWGGP